MSDYLEHYNRELARRELGDKVTEGTRPWRRQVERVRMGRLAWAKRLTRVTGLSILGSTDGYWVRWVNRELLDRLGGKLGLGDAGKAALSVGELVGAVSADEVRRLGAEVASEVEAGYREELSRLGIKGWLAGHKAGYVSGDGRVKEERTVWGHVREEFLMFWPWIDDLGDLVGGRRKAEAGQTLPGLTVDVTDLVGDEPEATVKVSVLKGRELAGAPSQVVAVFNRVAGYLALVGKPGVTEEELAPARSFFARMGLRLVKDSLTGYLAKDWSSILASELFDDGPEALPPEDYSRASSILVAGVRRMFEASGLSVNPECRESDNGLVLSTGLVEKAEHFGRGQLILREIARSGLVPKGHVVPRMDGMWVKRKTGTVYRSVVRPRLDIDREFWEAEGSPQSRSMVMRETLGDVRLASLLDGAAAGWLRRYMENGYGDEGRSAAWAAANLNAGILNANLKNLKAALDPAAPGALDPGAKVPIETWKELRQAIFDARVWAVHELFYGGGWMGLSPDYRRRLRLALKHFFSFVTGESAPGSLEAWAFVRVDSLFGKTSHTLLGEGLPYVAKVSQGTTLLVEGADLEESVSSLKYWTAQRVDPKEFPVMRTVARLLCAGRNRAARALLVARNLKAAGGTLPAIMRPVVPVDGPEPRAYLASLEASSGFGLSRLFDVSGVDVPTMGALAAELAKLGPKDFDLSFFDPRAAELAERVPVGGLRAQWEWARRHPLSVGLGGVFWYQEIQLLRLGLLRAYPGSVDQ